MEVVPLLVLCSLALAAIGIIMFWASTRLGDHEHATRLSLLPLDEDLTDIDSGQRSTKTSAACRRSPRT